MATNVIHLRNKIEQRVRSLSNEELLVLLLDPERAQHHADIATFQSNVRAFVRQHAPERYAEIYKDLHIAFGESDFERQPPREQRHGYRKFESLRAFGEWLNTWSHPTADKTNRGGWWCPFETRKKGTQPDWLVLVLDYDHRPVGPEVDGFERIVYASRSHSQTDPHWRVVISLAEPIPQAEAKRIADALGADTAAAKKTQLFWGRHAAHPATYHAGAVLDWRASMCKLPLVAPQPERPERPTPSGADAARIRALLEAHDPDASYDEWIRIGMAIHFETGGSDEGLALWDDFSSKGSKYVGIDDLESHWRSFGDHPRPVTLASLRVQRAASADDFDIVPAQSVAAANEPERRRFVPIAADQFAVGGPIEWHVHRVLPKAELCVTYGDSGSGKTFFVLDLVAAIARGVAWREREVRKGSVVYVCAEGAAGFRQRLQALERRAGVSLKDLPLKVIPDAPNMLERADALAVAREIVAAGGADVIVIDTLSAVTPGGNENSGEDVGKVIEHCKGLHRATGALVILIHHSGKDASKGARGWSGLRAAADAELEITRIGDARRATVTKSKDGEDGAAFGFRLLPVTLDLEGDQTSCVVQHVEVPPEKPKASRKKLGRVEKLVLRAVRDLRPIDGGGAAKEAVIEAVSAQLQHEDGKRDQRPSRVRSAIESLVADQMLRSDGEKLHVE